METVVKRMYEALFLVDSSNDWDQITGTLTDLLKKHDAEITSIKKWDDRKLAYEVEGKQRGLYILVYFNADTSVISNIERDVQLSEQIMRVMILRADQIDSDSLNKETPAMIAEQRAADIAAAEQAKKEESEKVSDEASDSSDQTDAN